MQCHFVCLVIVCLEYQQHLMEGGGWHYDTSVLFHLFFMYPILSKSKSESRRNDQTTRMHSFACQTVRYVASVWVRTHVGYMSS